jgi:hypothetical protein
MSNPSKTSKSLIWAGKVIKRFGRDKSIFKSSNFDDIVQTCSAVLNMKVRQGARDAVHISERSIDIEYAGGGSGTFKWQKPNRELDPTKAVQKDVFIEISPDNPIVTTGIKDLVSGTVIKAVPGIYQAAKDVPAAVTLTVVNYNVPQPAAVTGYSPGPPVTGVLDGNIFWIQWGGAIGDTMYQVSSTSLPVNGDWFLARKIIAIATNGTRTVDTVDVVIAKPFKLRHSITSASFDGVTVNYTYSSLSGNLDGIRVATPTGGTAENELVIPRWLVSDIVFATIPTNGTGVYYTGTLNGVSETNMPVILQDINTDGRAWAKQYTP